MVTQTVIYDKAVYIMSVNTSLPGPASLAITKPRYSLFIDIRQQKSINYVKQDSKRIYLLNYHVCIHLQKTIIKSYTASDLIKSCHSGMFLYHKPLS